MLLAPRYLPRLAATIGLFTRYGLRDFARRQGLQGIAPDLDDAEAADTALDARAQAIAFRTRLVELGPAYIKLGQVLSTRPDLLPDVYVRELEQLQDDVDPIPFAVVVESVEAELGGRLSKLFAWFEEKPLGTASLGQVHAAELRNGRSVVVKVQRPGIRTRLADDIEFFRELARFLVAHTKAGERVDLVGVIQQLERALADELDYRVEARNAATIRRALAAYPRLLIPKVVEGYTTERILTTERIRGVKISEISPLTRLDYEFRPVAEEITRAYLQQITVDGHFHADPHPGNIFVVLPGTPNPWTPSETVAHDRRDTARTAHTPLAQVEERARATAAPLPDDIDVKLSLIDFGMTARLSTAMKDGVIRLLLSISDNRGDETASTLVELGDPVADFDRQAYSREIASLVTRNYDLAIGEVQAGEVLYELIDASYQHGLRLPAELTLLAKTLFNLDAVGRALDPTFSPLETIREFSNRLVAQRARDELDPRRMMQSAMATGDLLRALPHRLDLITARMANNDFALLVDAPQLESLLAGLQKVANRIFSGLILAGLLIASAMLMPHRRVLATWGFGIAAVLGVYMVLSIWVTDRASRKA